MQKVNLGQTNRPNGQVKELTNGTPIPYVSLYQISEELLSLIDEKHEINLIVLSTGTKTDVAGHLITFLMARGASRCLSSITVVARILADQQLSALFYRSRFFLKGFCDEVFSITLFRSWIFNYE